MLADLASLERRVSPLRKRAQTGDKEAKAEVALMDAALAAAQRAASRRGWRRYPDERSGGVPRASTCSPPSRCSTSPMSTRPRPPPATRYSAQRSRRWPRAEDAGSVVISAAIEAEIAQLPDAEQRDFLESLGLDGARPRPADPRRLRAPRPHHLLHRRPKEVARLDDPARHAGAAGGRRHPHRFRDAASSAPRPSPMTTSSPRRRAGGQGSRQGARRRQGLRRQGRRRDAVQVQRVAG